MMCLIYHADCSPFYDKSGELFPDSSQTLEDLEMKYQVAITKYHEIITHENKIVGERDIIDLLEDVELYFCHLIMKGSNSIKVVLPVVL